MNETLFKKCSKRILGVKHVAEVGVYLPETSNVLGWINSGFRTTLVEADPITAEQCRKVFHNVAIHNVAVSNYTGQLKLYRVGASTFAEGLASSPALANDKYTPDDADSFTVPCVTFDAIDDGSIDVLSIDIEGGEWNVLQYMVSRPLVISVEMGYKKYRNPNAREITNWMKREGYGAWYAEGSDVVFAKKSAVLPNLIEKWSLIGKLIV
ncbi:MAG: FkbM family methyltransferase [Ignavibacteria bacterium]|nr:FkbM family methyltransferase [Ignavibacteria bacterium]